MIWLWGPASSKGLVCCCPLFGWAGWVVTALLQERDRRLGVTGLGGNLSNWAVQVGVTWWQGGDDTEMQSCQEQQLEGTKPQVSKLQYLSTISKQKTDHVSHPFCTLAIYFSVLRTAVMVCSPCHSMLCMQRLFFNDLH